MTIIGSDKGDSGFFGEPHQVWIDGLFDWQVLVLNFQKEIALAKNIAQTVGVLARLIVFFFHHRFGNHAAQARGKRDQPFVVLGKQIVVDARLVVEAFEKSGRDQLDKVLITFQRFTKQNQVIAAAAYGFAFAAVMDAVRGGAIGAIDFFSALVAAALGHVYFATDDRLDVALARFMEEIRGGKKIAVVGDGHRRHLLSGCLVKQVTGVHS